MKKIFVLILILYISNNLYSQEKDKIFIGMTMSEFKNIYPDVIPANAASTGQWGRADTLIGLAGNWSYNFKEGKLEWCLWNMYLPELSSENFNKCLQSTKLLIVKYAIDYGKPFEVNVVDTIYHDPYVSRHWGYDVIDAKWKTDNLKFKIEFTFMGGKGYYNFLVTMNFFDISYPYFE